MAKPKIIYKLPLEFQKAHGDVLEAWDWKQFPKMPLASALPDIPELSEIVLEAIPPINVRRAAGPAAFMVRIAAVNAEHASGAHMVRLRKYSDGLVEDTPESVSEGLAAEG